jgi:DNA-binding IclR family transcriptional regulator
MTSVYTLLRGQRFDEEATEVERRALGLQLLALAAESGGRLSVTQVATRLGLEMTEAERALDGIVDGRRVDIQTDPAGRIWYVFPELMP